MKIWYVHEVWPVEGTITGRSVNVFGIVHKIIFLVDFGRMKLFGVGSFYLTVVSVRLCQLIVIVAPVVIWLQWVYVPVCLKDAVLIDIFHLKLIKFIPPTLVLHGRTSSNAWDGFLRRVILNFTNPFLWGKLFSCYLCHPPTKYLE